MFKLLATLALMSIAGFGSLASAQQSNDYLHLAQSTFDPWDVHERRYSYDHPDFPGYCNCYFIGRADNAMAGGGWRIMSSQSTRDLAISRRDALAADPYSYTCPGKCSRAFDGSEFGSAGSGVTASCSPKAPSNAEWFKWRTTGKGKWYWRSGNYLCGHYAGDYGVVENGIISYFSCNDDPYVGCTDSGYRYVIGEPRNGDIYGRAYESVGHMQSGDSYSSFRLSPKR